MGCTPEQEDDCDEDEEPTHSVIVGDFYIGKYEVTQHLWKAVMGNIPEPHFNGKDYPFRGSVGMMLKNLLGN